MTIIDLDTVLLSQGAVDAWRAKANAFGQRMRGKGIAPENIGTEQGEVMPDGSLRVFCETPAGTLEMHVGAGDWTPMRRA